MGSIAEENAALSAGQQNRLELVKIWKEVEDGKTAYKLRRVNETDLVEIKKEAAKPFIYSCLDPKVDAPWSLGDLCDEMKKGVVKIHADKNILKSAMSLDDMIPGKGYIPYGKRPVVPIHGKGLRSSEARVIIREIQDGKRQGCFANTRVLHTLTRITQDFVNQSLGIKAKQNSFTFHKYSLRYPKGFEGLEIHRVYKESVGLRDMNDFYSRAVVDFSTSTLLWSFMKYNTLKELATIGSIFCLPCCIDYVGEEDDAGFGLISAYEDAVDQGLALNDCSKFSALVDDVIMATVFMMLKKVVRNRIVAKLEFQSEDVTVPNPYEYMEMRWWDGCFSPILKVPVALASARRYIFPVDIEGSPLGTRSCTSIRKVVDLGLRYNEIVDVIHDIGVEPCNEVHVAARYGGIEAVLNYADACVASVDQAACCDCGDAAHDWAVDFGVGIGPFQAFVPRYKGLPQLAQLHPFTTAKYRDLIKKSQHGAFITSRFAALNREGTFWTDDWKPTFTMEEISLDDSDGECKHCKLIESWVAGRCLFQDVENRAELVKLMRKHIQEYIHLDRDSLSMPRFWGKIVEIAVGGKVAEGELQEFREIVEVVWKRLRYVLEPDADVKVVMESTVDTWLEIDKLFVKSHSLKVGNVVRRAVMGVLSIQLDRTDVAFYQRTMDGALENTLEILSQHTFEI